MKNHSQRLGWQIRILAVFSFEEQPSCSDYLQLYSPLLCNSCGYLPLWGSNTKSLSNANCHRCRRVRISGRIALYRVIGSHIRGGTGWRIKPVYPCGQRTVPNQGYSKDTLKILYQSNFFFKHSLTHLLYPTSIKERHIQVSILFVLLFIFSVSPILDSENSFHSSGINICILVLIFKYVAIHTAMETSPCASGQEVLATGDVTVSMTHLFPNYWSYLVTFVSKKKKREVLPFLVLLVTQNQYKRKRKR